MDFLYKPVDKGFGNDTKVHQVTSEIRNDWGRASIDWQTVDG